MAAGVAASAGRKVLLCERMEKPQRKVRISGKGRCNLTNMRSEAEFLKKIRRSAEFFAPALRRFSNAETVEFFRRIGVPAFRRAGKTGFSRERESVGRGRSAYRLVPPAGSGDRLPDTRQGNPHGRRADRGSDRANSSGNGENRSAERPAGYGRSFLSGYRFFRRRLSARSQTRSHDRRNPALADSARVGSAGNGPTERTRAAQCSGETGRRRRNDATRVRRAGVYPLSERDRSCCE